MKQIIQSYRDGEIWLADVPAPAARPEGLVVQTAVSVISAGTEKMITDLARKSLVGKAAARPDLVRKVIAKVRTEGFWRALQKVSAKLDTPVALGYSCAGTVVEAGAHVSGFKPGDRVACAGADYATHAEYNYVPKNLCVRIPDGVEFEDAAFATLGSIALQGVRQAEAGLGDRVAVIGLGVLGLLTVQLLKAAGCRVVGSDMDEDRLRQARELGVDLAVTADGFVEAAEGFTEGRGADAVIITAATPSNRPIEQAGEAARPKGRVVVVGAVGMEVPRDIYYRKELDLRLSMSYGPGRYDPEYEERGHDYPFPYVRWTEQRNMAAFLDLVAAGKVTPSKLVTHRFQLDNALEAYELLSGSGGEGGKYLGIVVEYPQARKVPMPDRKVELRPSRLSGKPGIAVIGAGNFAKGVLLPALGGLGDVNLVGLCDASGKAAAESAQKHMFQYATTNVADILRDANVHGVIIATRHDSHAQLVCEVLKAGKHVLVEKPLATTPEQLAEIDKTYLGLGTRPGSAPGQATPSEPPAGAPVLMVGFNRRFSSHARAVREFFAGRQTPLVISYRINAGELPRESWIRDAEEGGGRIVGEVCHFVDLCQYLAGAKPVRVCADCIRPAGGKTVAEDSVAAILQLADGSVASILYTAMGPDDLAKERIEVIGAGKAAVIDNFARTDFTGGSVPARAGARHDKGFEAELAAFAEAMRSGEPPIAYDSLVATTRATFGMLTSIKTGRPVDVSGVGVQVPGGNADATTPLP